MPTHEPFSDVASRAKRARAARRRIKAEHIRQFWQALEDAGILPEVDDPSKPKTDGRMLRMASIRLVNVWKLRQRLGLQADTEGRAVLRRRYVELAKIARER